MSLLGDRLRREREKKGVSLETISAQTRIGVRFFKAIEEDTPHLLPGGIFNKSFVRQYARYLGVDEEQAVREYLQAFGGAREPEPEPETHAIPSLPGVSRQVLAGIALALILVVSAAVWYLWPRPTSTPLPATPSATTASPARSTVASPMEPTAHPPTDAAAADSPDRLPRATVASEPAPENSAAAPSPAPSVPTSPPQAATIPVAIPGVAPGEVAEELLLHISARSTVWLSITADGEPQWQGTLEANQSRNVQAYESIRLTVGNAAGVELTLNGKAVGALGREGEVKTVTLAARALQNPAPQP